MHITAPYLTSLLLAASSVSALPSAPAKTFSVTAIHNTNFVKDSARSLIKSHRKFGRPISKALAHEAHRRQSLRNSGGGKKQTSQGGSVSGYDIDSDSEYVSPVQVGTPPQTLNLQFDTGSSDLWLFSTEMPKHEYTTQHVFDEKASSTAKKTSARWDIGYADGGYARGSVITDVVSVGGVTFKNQAVELAQDVSQDFTNDTDSHGLLGLGFDSGITVRPAVSTWFTNVKESLPLPIFTSRLRHNQDGVYTFGYIDQSLYSGNLTYTRVNTHGGYWGFTSTGYAIGNGKFKYVSIKGIADTGTTGLQLPYSIANDYWSNVKGAVSQKHGAYAFPCNVALPSLTFGIEGARITIPGDYINYGPLDDQPGLCDSGLSGASSDDIVFGDVALKAAYVVWDADNLVLGWAQGA